MSVKTETPFSNVKISINSLKVNFSYHIHCGFTVENVGEK